MILIQENQNLCSFTFHLEPNSFYVLLKELFNYYKKKQQKTQMQNLF